MDVKPVNLTDALASFDEIYSPRIVGTHELIMEFCGRVAWRVV